MSEFKRIPPEQAQALREQGAVVVDSRDQPTYAAAHITGASRSAARMKSAMLTLSRCWAPVM